MAGPKPAGKPTMKKKGARKIPAGRKAAANAAMTGKTAMPVKAIELKAIELKAKAPAAVKEAIRVKEAGMQKSMDRRVRRAWTVTDSKLKYLKAESGARSGPRYR